MESLKKTIDKLHARGLTHAHIARRLDVSRQKWNDYKSGAVPMPTMKLAALARLADVDPVHLVGEYMIERAKKKGRFAPALGALLVSLAVAAGDEEKPRQVEGARSQSIHYAKSKSVFRARWAAWQRAVAYARELAAALRPALALAAPNPLAR